MIQTFLIRLLQMLALVALQVLVLGHIQLWGYATPIIVPLLLAYMPLGTSRISTMLWAFCAGLIVDIFSNTPGVCSGAMTFTAMLQPPLLGLMVPRDSAEDITPTYATMGTWNHIRYVFILFLLHHTAYFMLEAFSFYSMRDTAIYMGSSLAMSFAIALLLEGFRKKDNER